MTKKYETGLLITNTPTKSLLRKFTCPNCSCESETTDKQFNPTELEIEYANALTKLQVDR